MFNTKLVLLAIFVVIGCAFAHIQQGEGNSAYVSEKAAGREPNYDELALQKEKEQNLRERRCTETEGSSDESSEGDSESESESASSSSGSHKGTTTSSASHATTSHAASSSSSSHAASTSGHAASSSSSSHAASTSGHASSSSGHAASTSTSAKSSTTTSSSSSSSSSSLSLCEVVPTTTQPLQVLVPLYEDPDSNWDTIASAASSVQIIAIINPDNGPDSSAGSYTSGIATLTDAGVDVIGYVYTSYGDRAVSDVETDIDTWAAEYAGVQGIFFDEVSGAASDVAYYTELYNYVISKGMTYVIMNPGDEPTEAYVDISTTIVIFEDSGSNAASQSYSSWVTCASDSAEKSTYKYKFAGIGYATSSGDMPALINTFQSQGMGMVYATDGSASGNTYGSLASYFTTETSTVESLNE